MNCSRMRKPLELMNELFVNIKVDREERPDIDHIYMTALHALGQQGGWPLTMFLTPHGQPMLGGTYWPPEPRWGRPSFRQVLESVDAAWRARREEMERRGLTLTDHLATLSTLNPGPGVTPEDLTRIGDALLSAVDPVHGGLRGAPKFPNAPIFRFFWNEMFRRREAAFGEALRAMLEAMNAGGIYDHLAGGYARYSTDAEWLVPHFEKMLYDNAQILELLALVHSLRPDPTFAERARETVGWLTREMRVGDAFAASLDADQDGEEGLFYVWREDEIDAALGDAAARFKAAYDVTRGGNWEGRTVLRRVSPRGSSDEEAELAASRAKLFAVREARPKPSRDDKVLADWNGLTIAALVRASAVFGEPAWIATARAAFDFVMGKLRGGDGRLLHAWREGHPGARALIDDYASMARAALALFEAGGEPRDLDAARSLAAEALDLFGDGAGGVYLTASDAADVPGARPRQAHDGASPSGVGLLAEVFVRLWHLTDEPRWREAADSLIRAVSGASGGLGGSPLTLDERRHARARRLGRHRRAARRSARPGAGGSSARRARSVADRSAPRSKSVAGRPAARRAAANPSSRGDAVSGTDLQPAGDDAGGAEGAHGGATRNSAGLTSGVGLKPPPTWRSRGSAPIAREVLRLGRTRKLRRQLYREFELQPDQPLAHECAEIVSPHEFLERRVQILERRAAHAPRQRAPDIVGEVADRSGNGGVRSAVAVGVDRPAVAFRLHHAPERLRLEAGPVGDSLAKDRLGDF